jgi:hypothetical protein
VTDLTLDEFLLDDATPEGFASQPNFTIEDDSKASWAMKHLAVAQRKIDAINRQGAEEIERVERWVAYASKSSLTTVEYFSKALESYALRMREEGRKSISFPDGEISTRSTPEKTVVDDLETFVKWASEHRLTWIRTKNEPHMETIKKDTSTQGVFVVDNATGEIVDGLSRIEGSVSVKITVSE